MQNDLNGFQNHGFYMYDVSVEPNQIRMYENISTVVNVKSGL